MVFFLHGVRWWEKRDLPLQVGALVMVADWAANLVEVTVRSGFHLDDITPEKLWALLVVASMKGLAVILLADILMHERNWTARKLEEEQLARRLMVGSNLHMEAFFLDKSMAQVETVMARSHELYQQLKGRKEEPDPLASMALDVAKDVHEIKKDLKRLAEGLNGLLADGPPANILLVKEIVELVAKTNRSYGERLGKRVTINVIVDGQYVTDAVYPLVSILNNLVQNAVEAVSDGGEVTGGRNPVYH
ncbi:MAG: ATP-binding protein [Thermincolia bacterium]